MIQVVDEQENYLLVTDGTRFTVTERRAGRYYPLGRCSLPGVELDDTGFEELVKEGGTYPLPVAKRRLNEVASLWRDLFEHVR